MYASKILVLRSNRKAKVKWKCAECLTYRTFFEKINDEYNLEQLAKHLLFFTVVFYKRKWRHIARNIENINEDLYFISEDLNSNIFKTKSGRLNIQSKCADCGIKKSRFVKQQEAKGLLSNLGIKTPLSKIPLLNILF